MPVSSRKRRSSSRTLGSLSAHGGAGGGGGSSVDLPLIVGSGALEHLWTHNAESALMDSHEWKLVRVQSEPLQLDQNILSAHMDDHIFQYHGASYCNCFVFVMETGIWRGKLEADLAVFQSADTG